MFIDNLDKIIGMVGLMLGIELVAIFIFTVSIAYFRSPVVAGVIGNMSSLGMTLGVIFAFVKKEMN
jgi:xanthosine utilization system XapX-like protein